MFITMVPPDTSAQADLPDRFAGTDPDPVPDGGILTVAFEDPDRGGQNVVVVASDGDDPSATAEFGIHLRGNGRGRGQFIVPVGWGSVVLTAPGSRSRTIAVALPP